MQQIEYRITYTGKAYSRGHLLRDGGPETETVTVFARGINSGFTEALKRAREPLGSGARREILSIEFWAVK